MSRGQFAVMSLVVAVAVFAGVVVASLVPPVARVAAQDLELVPPPPGATALASHSFADLVERTLPAVVQVTTTSYEENTPDPMLDNPFFRRFFRDEENDDEERDQRQRPVMQGGSGFFITEDGFVLTNRHVVEDGDEFRITTFDDQEYEARLVGTDPYLDLALLKVDVGRAFTALPLGNSDDLRIGEWVIAIGHPIRFENTVTAGIVSGKGRLLAADARDIGRYIQTDAAINFGNSGGPLLNVRGEVVGVNTAIVRGGFTRTVEGLGFALPINSGKRVLEELASTGTVRRGWLGVTIQAVDREEAEYFGLDDERGASIVAVSDGSPADDAGLEAGDIILSVNGDSVIDNTDLVDKIAQHRPSEVVDLGIFRPAEVGRGGERMDVEVRLGERRVGLEPDEVPPMPEESSSQDVSALGFTVEAMRPEMRERLEERGTRGLLVTEVDPQSQAYRKGLRPGLVVVELEGRPVTTLDEYREIVAGIQSGQIVRVLVESVEQGTQTSLFFRAP